MTVLLATADLATTAPTLSSAHTVTPTDRPQAPKLTRTLSGVVVNQNQTRTGSLDIGASFIYQKFLLPHDYPRGTEQAIPDLTGIQVCVNVTEGLAKQAALDYRIEYKVPHYGWVTLTNGVAVGVSKDSNEIWFNIFFPPENVERRWDLLWRFGIKSRVTGGPVNQEVTYTDDKQHILIDNAIVDLSDLSPAPLDEGQTYPFVLNDVPSMVEVESGSGKLFYSAQQGIEKVWATAPNPLANQGCKATGSDGITPLNLGGQEVSLLFRVLSATADSGRDFLGNKYRSIIVRSDQNFVDHMKIPPGQGTTDYWLSKPNPTRFAIESLYFDVRSQTAFGKLPSTVEKIMVDPLTPGVWFNLYWTDAQNPGTDEDTWDHLLWTPVRRQFQMKARTVYELPRPIVANFIKLEFTLLQGRYYSPSKVLTKMEFKRFPKWVVDYFHHRIEAEQANTSGNSTTITYDAHDLLYNIYDDTSDPPVAAETVGETSDTDNRNQFIESIDTSQADASMLGKINLTSLPFLDPPFAQGKNGDILQDQGFTTDRSDYSTEQNLRPGFDPQDEVPAEVIDDLKAEKFGPAMQFYQRARHYYKKSVAPYSHSRAFFAGVKKVAILREELGIIQDTSQYRWVMSDNMNIEQNDIDLTSEGGETFAGVRPGQLYLDNNLFLDDNLFLG